MDKVFKVEHEANSWSELKILRETKSRPLMVALKKALEKHAKNFFPKDSMTDAINYVLSNWREFIAFTFDLKLPVSNNESERALRQAILGKKNYRGSKTIDAADQAAILFTIIETCKKAELDPRDYVKYVIENNHHGLPSLSPLKLAIKRRGRSKYWPEIV